MVSLLMLATAAIGAAIEGPGEIILPQENATLPQEIALLQKEVALLKEQVNVLQGRANYAEEQSDLLMKAMILLIPVIEERYPEASRAAGYPNRDMATIYLGKLVEKSGADDLFVFPASAENFCFCADQ